MMLKKLSLLLVLIALITAALACNRPTQEYAAEATAFAIAVKETVAAAGGAPQPPEGEAPEGQQPPPPAPPSEPSGPVPPDPTFTPTLVPTAAVPMVSVSVNTNCRTGPGSAYDLVGGLLVGETARIVALSSVDNYVIIELPDGSGVDCWLWMQYGTQTGSTAGLPVYDPPPTPTPPPAPASFSASFDGWDNCGASDLVFYRVINNGSVPFESFRIQAEDVDTGQDANNQSNTFPTSSGCIILAPPSSLPPGGTGYIAVGFIPPIGGDTILSTITLCTADGLGGDCLSQQVSYVPAAISDVNAKENFAAVDIQQILERLLTLPITSWTYIDQAHEGRHIGPMAQDFNPLFGVGEYENLIQVVDTYGVAFAAIQALAERNEVQAAELAELEAQNEAMLARMDGLEERAAAGVSWVLLAGVLMVSFLAGWVLRPRLNARVFVRRTMAQPDEKKGSEGPSG